MLDKFKYNKAMETETRIGISVPNEPLTHDVDYEEALLNERFGRPSSISHPKTLDLISPPNGEEPSQSVNQADLPFSDSSAFG